MTPKRRAALNFADTLLAGEATLDSMLAGADRAFGKKWRWMPAVCKHILQRTADHFHDFSRLELADIVEAHDAYDQAWNSQDEHPRIARYALDPPRAVPRPEWVPHHLPRWGSSAKLAEWLGLSPEELTWFSGCWRQDATTPSHFGHYGYRWVIKRSGGYRLIEMPKSRLRDTQQRLLHGFLEHLPTHQAAHGFRVGRSCLSHAALHQNKAVVVRMDLQDFFSSIPASRIHALFTHIGCPAPVARLLTGISTHRTPWHELNTPENRARIQFDQRQRLNSAHLPQGAPTSPTLSNLCAFRLDLRLDALAKTLSATYSRYADDLVFSGERTLLSGAQRFHIQVAAIALEEGFRLNTRKTRFMGAAQRQKITGLVVNRHPNIPRQDYDHLKAVLHNSLVHGATQQNRGELPDFRAHLFGKISYVASINPARALRLKQLFDQIDWSR